ncbi:hypothetical protein C8R43DRAFT_1177826 [Mycena crocata]|nr:hypothetical protein C8R43DRAFT_1177826 [Mycena crocata]
MPKVVPFAPKPAIVKLPLAVRKDNFQTRIKELAGTDFTININAAEVWAYADEGNTSAGTCFSGLTFFNEAVTQSKLTLAVNPLGDKPGETITSDVKDGVYRILFRRDRLVYNQNWLDDTMLPAIESAPREGFSLSAKNSIENDYEGEIDEVRDEINKLVGAEVTLDPNFEELYKALSILKDNDWQARIGVTVLNYFKGLKYQLEYQDFKDDDMLQEGLQEIVETKTFKIRIVPKTKSTIETVIEDGVVYVQCATDRWGYSTNDAGSDLIKLL